MMVRLNIDRLRRLRREWLTSEPPEQAHEDVLPTGVEPWLADALASLTPRQRTAVVLRYVNDLGVSAIAREMECSAGTAKSHLSRALAELRRHAAPPSAAMAESSERDG